MRLAAEEDRLDALLAAGRHAELVGELEALVERHPLRERLRGQLLLALYRAGRQSDALEAYARARDDLIEQLGVEPGPDLRELQVAILNQDPVARRAAETRTGRLPAAASSADSPRWSGASDRGGRPMLLREHHVVTLLGPAASGRPDSRSPLPRGPPETTRTASAGWSSRTCVIRRSCCPRSRLQPGSSDALAELDGRRVLLVLDNLEQVLGCSASLAELAARAPDVRLLVTSREPLDIAAERRYQVPLLEPVDAMELFLARADALGVSLAGSEDAVAGICRRLDGLPLALELAAARLKLLSPEELLVRLQRSLELLAGGARDLPERQRTMRSTIAWSDALLSVAERAFFHRMSVFSGGCTLEAAEAVCNPGDELGDTLTLAETLLDASLVHAQAETDGETRLQLLQTIGEYADESLAADGEEREAAMNRHGEHFLFLAEQAEPHLTGADQARWIARIEHDQDNFREALAFAVDTGQVDRELRLAGSLGFFWSVRGRHLAEGRRHLDGALARGGAAPADVRAKALRQNAWIAIRQGQLEDALSLAEEAVEIYRSLGDVSGTHNTLDALAAVLIETGEAAKARPVLEESLALARTLGNVNYVAATLNNLASLALAEQEYGRAQELATESFESSLS